MGFFLQFTIVSLYAQMMDLIDGARGVHPHSWKLKLTPHIKAFIYSMIKSQDFCFETFKRHPLVCQVECLFYDAAKNKKSTGICIANGMRDWEYSDNNVENNVKC